jgi:hypothetical protein
MHESIEDYVGQSLFNYQAALVESGSSLGEFIRKDYIDKWLGDDLYNALAIRTTFVNALQLQLAKEGLFNIERVSVSPLTDPLAHDVEHTPSIRYKGHTYMTTHSMIYSKLLALFNPRIKGIFVDSPNIPPGDGESQPDAAGQVPDRFFPDGYRGATQQGYRSGGLSP